MINASFVMREDWSGCFSSWVRHLFSVLPSLPCLYTSVLGNLEFSQTNATLNTGHGSSYKQLSEYLSFYWVLWCFVSGSKAEKIAISASSLREKPLLKNQLKQKRHHNTAYFSFSLSTDALVSRRKFSSFLFTYRVKIFQNISEQQYNWQWMNKWDYGSIDFFAPFYDIGCIMDGGSMEV